MDIPGWLGVSLPASLLSSFSAPALANIRGGEPDGGRDGIAWREFASRACLAPGSSSHEMDRNYSGGDGRRGGLVQDCISQRNATLSPHARGGGGWAAEDGLG